MIEIRTLGGYNEIGKNMTAVKVDDEVIILDMGIHLEKYIRYIESENPAVISATELISIGAIPDDKFIEDWKDKVKAIIPTHAHLDHVGAIPFLAKHYKAPILATPYTAEVLYALVRDHKKKLKNDVKVLNVNSIFKISDKITIEFVNITHSTPQVVMAAIHTPYGSILYANDFKFDNFPTLGKKPNYERMKKIAEKGVLALISDCTRADEAMKTPSESIAKEMLRDLMTSVKLGNKAVIITTFSSHIARLKSIIEFGKQLKRKIVFLGRSLHKYVTAAENIKLVNFSKDVEIIGYKKERMKKLEEINNNRSKYLIVCTGHQGEPGSVLSKIANDETPFILNRGDYVIFSCTVIPNKVNIQSRGILEQDLERLGVRIYKDIHVSGHASREDLRDLIELVKPKHVIPAHGDLKKRTALAKVAAEIGYKKEQIHLIQDMKKLVLE